MTTHTPAILPFLLLFPVDPSPYTDAACHGEGPPQHSPVPGLPGTPVRSEFSELPGALCWAAPHCIPWLWQPLCTLSQRQLECHVHSEHSVKLKGLSACTLLTSGERVEMAASRLDLVFFCPSAPCKALGSSENVTGTHDICFLSLKRSLPKPHSFLSSDCLLGWF